MRKGLILALAALAAAHPLAAKTKPNPDIELGLRCAAWASVQASEVEDPEGVAAFQTVFGYFVGLYQGASGKQITGAQLTEVIVAEYNEPAAWNAECSTAQLRLGEHLMVVGEDMQAAGAKIEAEEAAAAQ